MLETPFPFRPFRVFRGGAPALALILAACTAAAACPFCPTTAPTLSEQLARTDLVALGKWSAAVRPAGELTGRTTFEILQVVKAPRDGLKKGDRVALPRYIDGQEGDLFLLTGYVADNLAGVDWETPRPVTETAFQYVARAPSREAPAAKRLAYYLRYLEYPDPFIATDAYGEFAQAPYADVVSIKDRFSREDLRKWLTDPELDQTRRGLYGLMLGLAGTAADAAFLEQIIVRETDEFRLGIDGVIGGYLILTGEKGLDVIDRAKLANRQTPPGELFAAIAALRFFWTYGEGRISPDRLRQSLRVLLDRREVLDLVIADLARWQDWTIQDRLMEIYTAEDFDDTSLHQAVKRSIIRYFLACTRTADDDARNAVRRGPDVRRGSPDPAATARQHLATLREIDPNLVRQAERFFGDD